MEWNKFPSELNAPIRRLAQRLRFLAGLEGLCLWILCGVAVVALSFVFDWLLETGRLLRGVLLAIFAGVLVYLAYRLLISRLRRPISNESIALVLERRFPELKERLITAIECRTHPPAPALMEKVRREAEQELARIEVTKVLRPQPVLIALLAGTLALLAGVMASRMRPDLAEVWYRRNLLLEQVRYPRQTTLICEGFQNGLRRVPRGRDVSLSIQAGGVIPERATLEIGNSRGGERNRHILLRTGDTLFKHTVRAVIEPLKFRVRAGDNSTDWLTIEPVDPPTITSITARVTLPSHHSSEPMTEELSTARLSIPSGSIVELALQFSKPFGKLKCTGAPLVEVDEKGEQVAELRFVAMESTTLRLDVTDETGIQGLEPYPIDIVVKPDLPPVLSKCEPSNVGPALTRLAAVPFAISLKDDVSIERLQFELKRSGEENAQIITLETPSTQTLTGEQTLELGPFDFKVGDKFTVALMASDLPAVESTVHTALEPLLSMAWQSRASVSPTYLFEVVSPEEMMSRLAVRELNYRHRFEQTVRECQEARKSLVEVIEKWESVERAPLRLRLEDTQQTIRKATNETRELARSFRGLIAELRNNRCASSSTLERLEVGIAKPLESLVMTSLPECEQMVDRAVANFSAKEFIPAADAARQSMDRLLARAQEIIDSMLKLESFNELVSALRIVRDEQKKLLEKTKEERKQRILDLIK